MAPLSISKVLVTCDVGGNVRFVNNVIGSVRPVPDEPIAELDTSIPPKVLLRLKGSVQVSFLLGRCVNTKIPFFWVVPTWAGVASVYFLAAYAFLWRKTGVNMWKVWRQTSTDNLKTERRFAEEIRRFPQWHFAYQVIKWGTLAVVLGYLTCVFVFLSRQ